MHAKKKILLVSRWNKRMIRRPSRWPRSKAKQISSAQLPIASTVGVTKIGSRSRFMCLVLARRIC